MPSLPVPEKKPRRYVNNETVKRLQGLAMMRDIMKGMAVSEVARKYGVSNDTVNRRLSYADRAGLFTKHEDTILEGMVPLAERIILKHLQNTVEKMDRGENGDIQTALDIYKGTGLFRKPGTQAPAVQGGGDDSLSAHIQKLRERAALHQNTVDAELLLPPHSAALLTAADTPAGAGLLGLPAPSPSGDDGEGEAGAEATHRGGLAGPDGEAPPASFAPAGPVDPEAGDDGA